MEPIDCPFLPSSRKDDLDKVEEEEEAAVDLLEECWFFENLLDRKARMMSRCNSDLCPSTTSFGQEMNFVGNSCVETSSPIRKVLKDCGGDDGFLDPDSDQAPSPSPSPLCYVWGGEGIQKKEVDLGLEMSKLPQKLPRNGLLRTPSLPPCIGREKVMTQDEESDHELGKLISQASLNPQGTLPTQFTSKGVTRRIARAESLNMDIIKQTTYRYLVNQKKMMKKSLNDLEIEEVQGFKDLGFRFDKEDLSPSVVDILPGLQENKRIEPSNEDNVRRPYLSEAWLAQSSAPPIPNWVVKKSREDMKAQIKFWARAVASNCAKSVDNHDSLSLTLE